MRYVLLTLLVALLAPAAALAQGGGQPAPPVGPAPPAPPTPPAPELVVEKPAGAPLIREGQTNRTLVGGRWYFRQDDTFVGDAERWFEQADLAGWTAITVPHNWNAADVETNRSSVGWYRKEFTLPASPKKALHFWKVRFEGASFRTKLWLNGRVIGGSSLGYFPFEADLDGLRKGRNTLVIKVSNLRSNTDLTHWRPAAFNGYGSGGWWNFGGLSREVYMRRIDTVDIEDVHVLPRLRCLECDAKVQVRAYLRNMTGKKRHVTLTVAVGGKRFELDTATVAAESRYVVDGSFTLEKPELWEPGNPRLYRMVLTASELENEKDERTRERADYLVNFGVRKLETAPGGLILLNGRQVNLRGASVHEDDRREGAALSQRTRALLLRQLKSLGATVTRSHYPLHPAFIESLDRAGILYWVQVPVYQWPNTFFDSSAQRVAATRAASMTVRNQLNNPSVLAWSLTNEPGGGRSELGAVGTGLARYLRDGAAAVRQLDDTRLVAFDRQSRLGEPLTDPAFRHLDALGVNEYFGWYDSVRPDMGLAPTQSSQLSGYLDELHAANPDLPLVITEYGAEATRTGPRNQPGSYEFQSLFAREHLKIHTSKPYVNGSIYWALRDFRVDPTWLGGAPPEWALPPWHNKSLIEEWNQRKPVFKLLQKRFRATKPLRRADPDATLRGR